MPESNRTPQSLDVIHGYLDTFEPPDQPFAPVGEWEHRYSIRLVHRADGVDHCDPVGGLVLTRSTRAEDHELSVAHAPLQPGAQQDLVTATLHCRQDELGTLVEWECEVVQRTLQPSPLLGTEFSERGRVDGTQIRRFGERTRHMKTTGPVTCDWSLMEAVQRLPFEPIELVGFSLLEELNVLRQAQRLRYQGRAEVGTAHGPTVLHAFERFGEGVLPTSYWLDESHRLLFVVAGLRAYLYQSDLRLPEVAL